ncbi:MAG: glycosidase [Candidatus Eisenbacteria bacterium]|uniref:Glycosidase n=1 Tax=Eiseniibacteriota bacterium TaxID=2212470 RepID=A0A7Y2H1M5_UNCEI|nr:glycosidase [Candidatus Eisenbacteria bacterium]
MCLALLSSTAFAQSTVTKVVSDDDGHYITVDGEKFFVLGMNWGYIPIGTNYSFNLFSKPDDIIKIALDKEMQLLQAMGCNAIRQFDGIPPKWVTYIYEEYGIYTMMNHTMGRYGFLIDGTWVPVVDYSDPVFREAVKAEILTMVENYKDVPGVLYWLLGNENNYGLSWSSFEIEALPEGERHAARAKHLYSLYGEITEAIQDADPNHPVSIANGDVQYIDLIAEHCPTLDIFGTNVYRGISARDLYQVVEQKLGVPVVYTEFGCDAFNSITQSEDQYSQARYLLGQWQEIYEMSYGKGKVGNCAGGFTFQWSDGWWKFGQETRLDIHDTNASWPNGGYPDYVQGENNMNEEWFGICAKGPSNFQDIFEVYPRAAYYALREAYTLDPYAPNTDLETIQRHFGSISPMGAVLTARGDKAALEGGNKLKVSNMRLEFETISTGGKLVSTPDQAPDGSTNYPSFLGYDHMESFFADIQANPSSNVTGTLSLSVLGNVPVNPIDEIFYENRGRSRIIDGVPNTTGGTDLVTIEDTERVKVYQASIQWDDKHFILDGFYRTGHFHWGYEGDFFGLYREANYGENIDIYNGNAPLGVEITGKKSFAGLKLAVGPELWWGANPTLLIKGEKKVGSFDTAVIYQEDLEDASSQVSTSVAVPVPKTRKATVFLATTRGNLGIELGGIWGGNTKIGKTFQVAEKDGDTYNILQDEIKDKDAFGAKARLTYQRGKLQWWGQAAYMGLVADGGWVNVLPYTSYRLNDSNSGNQANVITGLRYAVGQYTISPNFLYQKPIVGPMPNDAPAPGRKRNVSVFDDPFAVRSNRETTGLELMLTYDPTPATWLFQWDNDIREDAPLAATLGLVYRKLHTTQDAATGLLDDGSTAFAFGGATPARDMFESYLRLVSGSNPNARWVANIYGGNGEPVGDDPRLIHRYGISSRLAVGTMAFDMFAKINDWGPYDYHRDFNLTYPVQLMGDISKNLGPARWFSFPQTRIGIRGTWRSLDQYSPRFCPLEVPDPAGNLICDPLVESENGNEWEIRTYIHLAL